MNRKASGVGTQEPSQVDVPAYIEPAEIAKALRARGDEKATTEGVRGRLARCGILEKHGRWYYVGRSKLRERLPEWFEDVFAWFVLDGQRDGATRNDG